MGVGAPSGTVTFLFTDIEGSTRLWQHDEEAMRAALERHDSILRSAIDGHDGYVFSTGGDGFAAAFARAGNAVSVAMEAQRDLAAEPWPSGTELRVRMGLHTGEVTERDGDYFGTAVNQAARLMALGHGGQVLCSAVTAGLAGGEVTFVDLGEHRLRDLSGAQQVFQVGPGRFPPLRSVDAVPTNLPTVRTELIGRRDDIAALTTLVDREQLVTLTGVGGVGKTRLALGVAAASAPGYADGCWLVELAPVADEAEALTAVATAIRAPATDIETLVAYLVDRRMLVVLDNAEHVLGAVAELVDAVLGDAPEVHVVVTSREPLGLDGEQVRRVQSLGVPTADSTPDEVAATAAVRLFVERAAAVSDGFAVMPENVDAVAEICRHLDGIPLAIELAAARVRAMPPAEIAGRLGERFRLLSGGSRRAQERHRTLLATVSWSHDLLSDDEKVVFRRLAVFPASFDLAAAGAVAGDGERDVLEDVVRLVDRSLVQYEPDTGRYRFLETLRQFAADRLAEAGETDDTRARHAAHFLGLTDRVAPELLDARFPGAHQVLIAELDNLRAVADWCVEDNRWVELARMAHNSFYFLGDSAPVDGAAWYRHVLDHAADLDPQVVVDAYGELAWLSVNGLGDFAAAVSLAEQSRALAEGGESEESANAWLAQAMVATYTSAGDIGLCEQAFNVAEARHDEVSAVVALGIRSHAEVDAEASATCAVEALRRAERIGHPNLIMTAVSTAAGSYAFGQAGPDFHRSRAFLSGFHEGPRVHTINYAWLDIEWGATLVGLREPGAAARLAPAIRIADQHGSPHALELALRLLVIAAGDRGHWSEAATLIGYADTALSPHRIDNPGTSWVGVRLDEALAAMPDRARHEQTGAAASRRQILEIVNELESVTGEEERTAEPE